MSISDAVHASFPKENLVDDRFAGSLFKFAGVDTDPAIYVNLGNAPFETGIDRLIIPPNHNLASIRISESSTGAFGGEQNYLTPATAVTAGEQIDVEFATAQSKQYLGFEITGTAQYYFGQLYFTKIVELEVGPNLATAIDEKRANVARLNQPTGISVTAQLGPQQRYIEYEYDPPITGTDLTKLEALIADVGMSHPFYVDPAAFTPFTDEPVLPMKFAAMPRTRNSVVVPHSGARAKTFDLAIIESLD